MTFIRFEPTELHPDDLLTGDVKLGSPPEIYVKLHRLIEKPDSTVAMLAHVIEHDPGLTARVLRVANSPFYALPHKVHGIVEAINILGIRELQQLVLATEVMQRFDAIPEDLANIYRFWQQSLRCGVLARLLAQARSPQLEADAVFIGGLLHAVGQLVIYTRVPELGRKALLEHRYRALPLDEAERAVMGFDYAQVGAALANRWSLPERLQMVLAHHLHPEQAPSYRPEAAIVHLALAASRAESFAADQVRPQLPAAIAAWEMAGVTPSQLESLLPRAEQAYGAALALIH